MYRENNLSQAIAYLTREIVMEGRKCSLVKIAHCMNLKTDIWKPEERVRDGTTDGSSAAETLTILSNAERLP